jgi:hypothetical protein
LDGFIFWKHVTRNRFWVNADKYIVTCDSIYLDDLWATKQM